LLSEGRRKLASKGLDLIYANDIAEGELFGSDRTFGYLIDEKSSTEVAMTTKESLANLLLDKVVQRLNFTNV